MKLNNPAYKFVEWSSPDELHEESLKWKSELEFIKDEQHFLDELIKNHTLQLISGETYHKSLSLISDLYFEEKQVVALLERLQKHLNELEILTDGVDQLSEEKTYKENHFALKMEVSKYASNYRATKKEIFRLVKKLMKKNKQKKLSN